jgi:hypothetical protein
MRAISALGGVVAMTNVSVSGPLFHSSKITAPALETGSVAEWALWGKGAESLIAI